MMLWHRKYLNFTGHGIYWSSNFLYTLADKLGNRDAVTDEASSMLRWVITIGVSFYLDI